MVRDSKSKGRWIVGITGASGAIYGITLCRLLLERGYELHLVITDAGWRVIQEELGWNSARRSDTLDEQFGRWRDQLHYYPIGDIGANIASGSYRMEGMIIIPCSMGTLAAISSGLSNNLLQRAADVTLKEGRQLVIVPRETPLSAIHLDNMLRLAKLGVTIVPAMPAFYNHPETIDDLVHFQVGKALDAMKIDNEIYNRWGTDDRQSRTSDKPV